MWPIIVCPGRTARPSTCQSRTSDSQACGLGEAAVRRAPSRRSGTAGWSSRRRRRRCRRARSASAAASRHSQGASMSRMTRSASLPGRRERLGEVAERSAATPGGSPWAPKNWWTLRAGDVGELLAALVGRHPAVRADRAQQRAGERTRADAGLDDVRRRGRCRPARRSGRRPWGRPPRPRAASRPRTRASSGRKTRYSPPTDEVTVKPSSRPIRSSCSMPPRLVKKRLPGSRHDVVPPALLVGQPHPLARRAADRGARRTRPRRGRPGRRAARRIGRDPSRVGQAVGRRVGGVRHAAAPRRTLPERPVDVGGRPARRRCCRPPRPARTRAPGVRLMARTQVLAARSRRAAAARLERAGHRRDRHPGPALVRGREQRGLVDEPDRAGRCRSP